MKDSRPAARTSARQKREITRARLIEATVDLLRARPMAELTALQIARHAGLSNAAFYVYFPDTYDVLLAACETAGRASPELVSHLHKPWEPLSARTKATELVRGYFELWDRDRLVLLARNIAAEEGRRDFMRARQLAIVDVSDGLRFQIEAGQAAGRIPAKVDPHSAANMLLALLERTGSVQHVYEDIAPDWGQKYAAATIHVILCTLGFREKGVQKNN